MSGVRKDGTAPVHGWTAFANPYLYCKRCGQATHAWHDDQRCGTPHEPCTTPWYLAPCGHQADAQSKCPSWSPEGGCKCLATLGRQDHETARR